MDESSKTRAVLNAKEQQYFRGKGIDIGCGPDPITPDVYRFDQEQGDANEILKYVHDTFDFVYSSHCLEHMNAPQKSILDWWALVKPGGYLIVTVPDEDLYEQGVFPSRFNADHKATFTISKRQSWSPVSYNVFDLARALPNAEILQLELQDQNYDRSKQFWGCPAPLSFRNLLSRFLFILYRPFRKPRFMKKTAFERFFIRRRLIAYEQLSSPETLAQIFCVCQKKV